MVKSAEAAATACSGALLKGQVIGRIWSVLCRAMSDPSSVRTGRKSRPEVAVRKRATIRGPERPATATPTYTDAIDAIGRGRVINITDRWYRVTYYQT